MKTNESQRSTLFKGLRLKSPTNMHTGEDQLQRTSPLRTTGFAATQQFADAQSFSEIQPLESQTELLRREIQAKESVLDRITESKDRLRMRISNTLGLSGNASTTGVNLRQKTLANSISQTSIYGQDFYTTNQDRNRDITPPSRDYNRKSTSPLRQQQRFTSNQPVESFPSLQQQSSAKEANFVSFPNKQQNKAPVQANLMMQSESLQQLQTDNSQLQRRLNLVVAELDRMNREKHQSQQQLGALHDETEYFRKKVEDEQRPDKSTDMLHEEIFVSRDQNRKVQNEILQVDRARQDAVTQLRIYQAERERRVSNCEDLSSGLQNKLAIMKNIETEIQQSKEQIERINSHIRSLERKLKDEDRTNQDIQNLLHRLQRERDDLHIKLGQLSQNYDQAVAELSKERLLLESHNKRHMQLLSSKAIFSSLIKMSLDRKQFVLNEIASYCKFDNNCHRALHQFSQVLKSCGHYQMRIGLKRWFQNALKPLQTRQQGYQLTNDLYAFKLKSRAFHKWINKRQSQGYCMSNKGKAAEQVCQKLVKWQQIDLGSSLARWRDLLKLQQQREQRLKVIVGRQYNNRRRLCFQLWFEKTTHWNLQMRLHILAKESASKQLLLICFSKFRKHTAARRQSRLMKLKHVLKAWRDSVAYRKYMMAQNVAASHMRKHLNQNLLLACLGQLRSNKELSKLDIVSANLTLGVQPAIQALIHDIEDQAEKELRQRKLRSLTSISNSVNTALKSYLNHWRNVAEWSQIKISTNMKQMVISLYKNKLQRAFNHWNNKRNLMARSQQEDSINLKLVNQKSTLSTQITSLTSLITNEEQRIDFNSKSRLLGATEILKRRIYTHYMNRWSKRNKLMSSQENQAQFVMQKLRNIICRQAFAIYKVKVKQSRQNDLDQDRADYFIETRRLRKVRQIYNAFCQYYTSYINQKKNISMAVTSIDIYLQRKAFFKWCDKGNLKRVHLLAESQNQQTMTFDLLNRNLGACSGQLSDQVAVNKQLKADLMLQAQRVLANAFQRYYYIKAQRGIQQWVKVVEYQRHLEDILKRQIQHLQKSMFYQVKAAFQNWIAQSKIKETKAEIVHTQFMIADAIQKTKFNRETHESSLHDFNIQTKETVDEVQEKTVKLNSSIQKIIQKNDQCHYQSRIRYIFNTWQTFTQRQKKFCLAIERVVSQSLYQQGFSNIHAFSRDKKLTRHQNSGLQQMRRMFWRKNCERAVALWNSKTFDKLKTEVLITRNAIQQEDEQFFSKVEQIKEQSCSTGNATMHRQNKQKNLIQSWRNAIMWEKRIRQRSLKFSEVSINQATQRAIKKWRERSQKTVITRDLTKNFKRRLSLLSNRAVFTAMVSNFRSTKSFLTILSNIAAKFDYRMKQNAVEMIQKFAESRYQSNCLDKNVAVKNIYNCLHQLYLRRMTSNLACLKSKMMVQKRKDKKIGNMLGHMYSRQLRDNFVKWKNQAHFESTVIEVNESGPVVEEVLHFQIECGALASFMTDQAYTPKQIEQAVQISENQAAEQIARSISRMKHFTQQDDLYLKPKMFDRWRVFVKMRKLMRYILRNMENKLQPIKADMSIAFNRWKFASTIKFNFIQQKHQDLNGVDRARLVARSSNNNQRLNELTQLVDQGDTFMGHMSVQRDELVDNYIKSQRLAIALARDNLEKGMRRSLNQMDTNAHVSKRRDFETLLERNINLIASLKERIQDFENDNVAVANENEELRQFSLDGYQIAKNVQSLSNERERLSVDLADKSNIIKKLLSENESLQNGLRQAQEQAIVLVHESQSTMRRMQQQRPLDY